MVRKHVVAIHANGRMVNRFGKRRWRYSRYTERAEPLAHSSVNVFSWLWTPMDRFSSGGKLGSELSLGVREACSLF